MDAVQMCKNGIRKAKVQVGLNLARDVKNKKGFYRYIDQKRQATESIPLINEKGGLAIADMERDEVLSELFVSVFTGNEDSHISCIPEPHISEFLGGNCGSKLPFPSPPSHLMRLNVLLDCKLHVIPYLSDQTSCAWQSHIA